MKDIIINPNGGKISVSIKLKSMVVSGYEIIIYKPDQTTIIEKIEGNSDTSDPFIYELLYSPSFYKDCYATCAFAISDPQGGGNDYEIEFSLNQDAIQLNPVINITGKTTIGKVVDDEIYCLKF